MAFDELLNQTATILRLTPHQDAYAGEVGTFSSTSTVRGRLRALSANERIMSGAFGVQVTHRWHCRPADISEADRLEIDGVEYDVLFVNDVHTLGRMMQIDLLERRPQR